MIECSITSDFLNTSHGTFKLSKDEVLVECVAKYPQINDYKDLNIQDTIWKELYSIIFIGWPLISIS
jgi:hypothetical protein